MGAPEMRRVRTGLVGVHADVLALLDSSGR